MRGQRPEMLEFAGAAESLRDVWLAVRVQPPVGAGAGDRGRRGRRDLPAFVADLLAEPDAFVPH